MPSKEDKYKKRQSHASTIPNREAPTGVHAANLRTNSTIRRLKMYKDKAIRNKKGKILSHSFQSRTADPARIAPSLSWFENTRIITQNDMENFREKIKETINPYTVMLQQKKIPWGLIKDSNKESKMKILDIESFGETFGPKKLRKKPKINFNDVDELVKKVTNCSDLYKESKDRNIIIEKDMKDEKNNEIIDRGKSKRLWSELYKVIDSSDILIQVLDARDPMGTRSSAIEKYLEKEKKT